MILRSRAIWASKGCVIGDAVVRVRGDRITGVGGYGDLLPDDGEPVVDIGESIIFPAFVNAHCHLEYSGLAGELSRDVSFTDWLNQMVSIKQSLTHDDHETAWLAGAEMLLRSGCGTVVNIESLPGLYKRMAPETPLLVCPFTELIGYHPEDVSELVDLAKRELMANAPLALNAGLSAHAPYTVTPEALNVLAMFADEHSLCTTIHLAESDDEWEMFPPFSTWPSRGGSRKRQWWFMPTGSPKRMLSCCGGRTPMWCIVRGATLGLVTADSITIAWPRPDLTSVWVRTAWPVLERAGKLLRLICLPKCRSSAGITRIWRARTFSKWRRPTVLRP